MYPSVPLAAPLMRSVIPASASMQEIRSLRRVALAQQKALRMRGDSREKAGERDGGLTATAQLDSRAGYNNRMQRRPRSESRMIESVRLAAPLMRSVMPPQRDVLIDWTQRRVALALQGRCMCQASGFTITGERDRALTGTALLASRAGITYDWTGARKRCSYVFTSAARARSILTLDAYTMLLPQMTGDINLSGGVDGCRSQRTFRC